MINPIQKILAKHGFELTQARKNHPKYGVYFMETLHSKDALLEYGNKVSSIGSLEDTYTPFPQSLYAWWDSDGMTLDIAIDKEKFWDIQRKLVAFLGQKCVDELLAYQETTHQKNIKKGS